MLLSGIGTGQGGSWGLTGGRARERAGHWNREEALVIKAVHGNSALHTLLKLSREQQADLIATIRNGNLPSRAGAVHDRGGRWRELPNRAIHQRQVRCPRQGRHRFCHFCHGSLSCLKAARRGYERRAGPRGLEAAPRRGREGKGRFLRPARRGRRLRGRTPHRTHAGDGREDSKKIGSDDRTRGIAPRPAPTARRAVSDRGHRAPEVTMNCIPRSAA